MATKAESELAKVEDREDRRKAKEKAEKFQLTELLAAAGAGALRGYARERMPASMGFGPGEKLNLNHVFAIGGLFLSRKGKGRSRAIGQGAACLGIGTLVDEMANKAAKSI